MAELGDYDLHMLTIARLMLAPLYDSSLPGRYITTHFTKHECGDIVILTLYRL